MRSLVTLPAVLLATALSGCGRPDAVPAAPADPAARAAAAPVLLIAPEDTLTVGASRQVTGPLVSGSLQPERRADLRAEVPAVVQQVLKDNGEAVRAGELIVRLDDTAIRDSLRSADEAMRAATQSVEQAERNLQRLKTLQAQGMISTQALEDADVRRIAAQSDLVAARARQAAARQQVQRTEVRAPFAGVVSDRRVSAGDTAQVGKELVKVIDPSTMRFEGLVSADRLGELATGQPVNFRVNGYPDTDYAGRLRRIDATADPATRQVEVTVDFVDRSRAPRVAGLFAEGRIDSGGVEVVTVPEGALQRTATGWQVWRVDDGTIRRTPVRLGDRDPRSGLHPVLAGLSAGARILRSPGSTLVDGQRFEPAAAAPSAPAAATSTVATARPAPTAK